MPSGPFCMTSVPFVNLSPVYLWGCFSDNDKWEPAICFFGIIAVPMAIFFLKTIAECASGRKCRGFLRSMWVLPVSGAKLRLSAQPEPLPTPA